MTGLKLAALAGGEVTLPEPILEAFKSGLRGELILPGQRDYDEARRVWNGMIDRRPGIIVRCACAADVAACVCLVRDFGVRLAVRGGGHNVAGTAVCDRGLVADLSPMRGVEVDAAQGRVRIQGGATLGDVDRATAPHGLATPMGVVTATGYAGLSLHGGTGWQLRKHGLATDNITAVEIVTADGRLRQVDAAHDGDLLWALRGGGGNFGIVTSFTSRLHAMPREVQLTIPIFALEHAGQVLRFVRDYMRQASHDLMVIAALWTVPDEPSVPRTQRGRPGLFVLACHTGPADEAERVIGPLQQAAPPLTQLGGRMPWTEAQAFLDSDYPDGRRYYWKSTMVRDLSDVVIDRLVFQAATRPSPLTSIDIWTLGGAFAAVPPDATAFGSRDVSCLVAFESNWDDPEQDAANVQWTRDQLKSVQDISQARTYLNFAGQGEEGESLLRGAFGLGYSRLQALKRQYDPENVFRGHLNIVPGKAAG